MTTDTPAHVPAGWYPDPSGAPQQRWWDGTNWSQSTQPTPQPYGSPAPYTAQPYATPALRAPEGTNPTTAQSWVLALWPLLGFINVAVTAAMGGYSATYLLNNLQGLSSVDLVTYGISFVSWLGFAAVAFSDHRALIARQVPRPFHWAWGLLPIVYIIGRSVVVYSRTSRGLGPLFLWIGMVILNWVVGAAVGLFLSMMLFSS